MTQFGDTYRGRRVLLTGHTGFKGSWLALWLTELGADITGIALPPPTAPNHWDLLDIDIGEHHLDIRDATSLARVVLHARPEVVFHLAAQSLVRRSHCDPLDTWSTNVMGTANVLDACRHAPSIRAIVVVTSDKCYENREWDWGYREADVLGGRDPYSASKAGAELVASSYRDAFFGGAGFPHIATARAGNVIGGGDWGEDRLLPDLVRATGTGASLAIRSPQATRPWQHVLECLSGYLTLGAALLAGRGDCAGAWNFGPGPDGNRSVTDLLTHVRSHWPTTRWHLEPTSAAHEAGLLYLDSSKARLRLGWQPVWRFESALEATLSWYRNYLDTGKATSREQLTRYVAEARSARHKLATG